MPNTNANDGDQKWALPKQLTSITAPLDKTLNNTGDDGTGKTGDDTANGYAGNTPDKTAGDSTDNTTRKPTPKAGI